MSKARNGLSRQQIDEAIDREKERQALRNKPRTITTGFQMEKAVPTWSEWQLRGRPHDRTVVTATFCVNTLDGVLWAVQHKTKIGTLRDEADVFLDGWERVIGDAPHPARRKAPSSMKISERLKHAKSMMSALGAQLFDENAVRGVEFDEPSMALVSRVRRMWAVILAARTAVSSRGETDMAALQRALKELE